MRIIWHSNWIRAATGYGKQSRHVVCRLKQLGHEIYFSATYGIHGRPLEVDGIVHLPGVFEGRSNIFGALGMHVKELKPALAVTLMDVWPLPDNFGERIRQLGSRWIPWVPVDHDPCPEKIASRLQGADTVVAMSAHGQRALAEAGIKSVLIPHGVETDVFRPADKKQARAAVGLPEDAFMVVMVQANSSTPSRKCFQQQFDGFARFHKKHPDSVLYLHTWEGTEYGGVDLAALSRAMGIRDAIICQDQYQAFLGIPDEMMATLYQSADVTLNATGGEGFGVPIIESLACGTPIIVTDFTAMSELCPPEVGWPVGWTDRLFTPLHSFFVWPDPAQICDALEAAYQADREGMKNNCVEFARQYDAGRLVSEKWVPFLEEMVGDVAAAPDTVDIG